MLVSVSANHRVTPFDTLERLASIEDISTRLTEAHADIRGAVVLATCNRFEAYLDVEEVGSSPSPEPATTAVLHDLAQLADIPFRQLRDEVNFAHGNGVARHLFAVSSGLDSIALGEGEIAGQVRRALESAREHGLTTPSLEQLFQRATETSKRVKQSTALSESGRSLVKLALELASSRIADWAAARVLLIGTGRYAAVTLASLRSLGATHIRVSSASTHGAQFAATHDVPLIHPDAFSAAVDASDVIISCTSRDGYALMAADITSTPDHSLLVIDLGLPRNVEPSVAEIEHVELLDLETIRIHAPIDEFAHLEAAQNIVRSAARTYGTHERARELTPAIVAVRELLNETIERELSLLKSRDPEVTEAVRHSLSHFSAMLLHRVTQAGHAAAPRGGTLDWVRAVETVFDVKV